MTQKKPARPETVKANVTYVQPRLEELEAVFRSVSGNYAQAAFEPIDQCASVGRETREVTLEYVRLGRIASTGDVLSHLSSRLLRPALYEELLASAKVNPGESRRPIVALGSVAQLSPRMHIVASIEGDSLDMLPAHGGGMGWHDGCWFLAVRK